MHFLAFKFADGALCTAGRVAERKTGKREHFGTDADGCRERAWVHRASATGQHSPGVLLHNRLHTRIIKLCQTFPLLQREDSWKDQMMHHWNTDTLHSIKLFSQPVNNVCCKFCCCWCMRIIQPPVRLTSLIPWLKMSFTGAKRQS